MCFMELLGQAALQTIMYVHAAFSHNTLPIV